MIKISTAIFYCLISFDTYSQAPNIIWQKSLGGSMSDYSKGISLCADGGTMVYGASSSNDGDISGHHGDFSKTDACLIKLGFAGNFEWQKSLGGTDIDAAYNVQQTFDGGYIIAGITLSDDDDVSFNHGESDCWIVKTNATGEIEWEKSFGGSLADYACSIEQTNDGGYVFIGKTNSTDGDVTINHGQSDCWLVKIDASGTIEWQKTFGGSSDEIVPYPAKCLRQTADNGFVFIATTASNDGDVSGLHGLNDIWVLKTDSIGEILWQRCYGGSSYEGAGSIELTIDGGFAIAGSSSSNDGDANAKFGNGDYWVLKLTSVGDIQWENSYGGTAFERAQSIHQTNDEGFALYGYSYSTDLQVQNFHDDYDGWFIKLSAAGEMESAQSFGGSSSDIGIAVIQLSDSACLIAQESISNDFDVSGNHGFSDFWIAKFKFRYYKDADHDLYGNINSYLIKNSQPAGYTWNGLDCDDQDSLIHPYTNEVNNTVDDDCDGAINEMPICWQTCLGGSSTEVSSSIQECPDGGVVIAGYSLSADGDVSSNYGSRDYWIVKLKENGILEWKTSLGGSWEDGASDIKLTPDGGYIVGGYSYSSDGDVTGHHDSTNTSDCWVVKLDSLGQLQWQKSYGGSKDDKVSSICSTNDGGYILSASSNSNDGDVTNNHGYSDYWIVKLDAFGEIIWQKSFGGSKSDNPATIIQSNDMGYIITGGTYSSDGDVGGYMDNGDCWIVKLDYLGNIQWKICKGGTENDFASYILQTSDGGFIFVGGTESNDEDVTYNNGYMDFWVVKISSSGSTQWQKSFGGSLWDFPSSITQTSSGDFAIVGETFSYDGDVSGLHSIENPDLWFVLIDGNGNLIWQQAYGGKDDERNNLGLTTTDNSFIISNGTKSNDGDVSGNHGYFDFWVAKLSWTNQQILYSDSDGDGFGSLPGLTVNNCMIPSGYVLDSSDCNDLNSAINPAAIEILNGEDDDCDGYIDEIPTDILIDQIENSNLTLFPNPTSDFIFIQQFLTIPSGISIYTLTGNRIISKNLMDKLTLDLSEFPQGVYILEYYNSNKHSFYKVVRQ